VKGLLEYCKTERQTMYINAVIKHGSRRSAAKAMNVHFSTVIKCVNLVKSHAAIRGYSPEHDYTHSVPDTHIAKGVSTYYDEDGKVKAQWVKSALSQKAFNELLEQHAKLFFDDLPRIKPARALAKRKYDHDLIPWFQIGDAHLGMLAHEAETGVNFDLKIAVRELSAAFHILMDECEPCERCVINDLGDFTHYENFAGVTEGHGHALDFDGRFPKMIEYYVPLMRMIIDKALEKFKYVDIIINQGNHSRTNDMWMRVLLENVYEKTDRVNVLRNSNVFIPYRMGNTLVLTHHSDKCRPNKLAAVMASDYPKDWGEAEFRYIDMGHVHHGFTSKEHPGVMIESWNHLAAPDKYAHEGGWRSRQAITRVDRSRTYGDIGRRRLGVEEIRDMIRAGLVKGVKAGYIAPKDPEVYKV